MPTLLKNEPYAGISPSQAAGILGGLIANSPIWFDQSAGIASINTQSRRLGCLTFLIGKVAAGTRMESLLTSVSANELASLNSNLLSNGYGSGQITDKSSSVEHYLSTAMQLHLLTKQGAIYSLTNRGRFLIDAVKPVYTNPYPLSNAGKVFYLDTLMRAAFLGILTILRTIFRKESSLVELQEIYRDELLKTLDHVSQKASDSRFRRIAQDRTLTIRNWKKPASYSEHLVPSQLNWLLDLGIVSQTQGQKYFVNSEHHDLVEQMVHNVTPDELDIISWLTNFSSTITPIGGTQLTTECDLLSDAFANVAQPGALIKIRSADLILYLVCNHPHALRNSIRENRPLFPKLAADCGAVSYKFTPASRSTQSFVVCARNNKT